MASFSFFTPQAIHLTPYCHASPTDLMQLSGTPPYARISSNRSNGTVSPYGCGWNVCYLLGLVTQPEAQAGVDAIVHDHNIHGEASNPGLLIGQTSNPASICGIIHRQIPTLPRLTVDRFAFYPGLTAQALQDVIMQRYFPNHADLQFVLARGYTHVYMIIKFMIDFNTGLGHTILICFNHSPTPADPNTWDVFTCDPQLKRNNTFHTLCPYLIQSYNSGTYRGIACCVVDSSTGGRISSLRTRSKSLRSKSMRSKSMRSKSMRSKSSRKSKSLHVHGKDKILPNMYENLTTEFGTPFHYSPKGDSKRSVIGYL